MCTYDGGQADHSRLNSQCLTDIVMPPDTAITHV
jgi:hypothetical protein